MINFNIIEKTGNGNGNTLKQEKRLIFDLSGYTTGDYEVDLKIESDDPRVTYVVSNKVKLTIVQKNN